MYKESKKKKVLTLRYKQTHVGYIFRQIMIQLMLRSQNQNVMVRKNVQCLGVEGILRVGSLAINAMTASNSFDA